MKLLLLFFAMPLAISLALYIMSGAIPSFASTGANIVINEVELNPSGSDSGTESVELYNPTSSDIDVSGWAISSTAGSSTAVVTIDSGTVIPSKGHLIAVGRASQWLDNIGEVVKLQDESGNLVDSAGPFSDEDNDDVSWQRSPDGANNWVISNDTLGQRNIGTSFLAPEPEVVPKEEPDTAAAMPSSNNCEQSSSDATEEAALDTLKIVFIDVGQGSSNLIIFPNCKTMLIDGGERNASAKVLAALQENSVDRLDIVVATHPHADHIGGLIDIIQAFDVGLVVDSGQIHTTQTFEDLIDAIEEESIPLQSIKEGDILPDLGAPVDLKVLNPPVTLPDGSDDEGEFNNNSVVIKLTYRNFTALFTGDMEEANEARLTSSKDVDADVLTAGHHGSRTSNTAAFLGAVSPKVVVISLGADNKYGHPHQEALERIEAAGIEHVFRTDIDGTIALTTAGDGSYTLDTSRSNKTVVVPEFPTAIMITAIAFISAVLAIRGRAWKSLEQA